MDKGLVGDRRPPNAIRGVHGSATHSSDKLVYQLSVDEGNRRRERDNS